MGIPFLDGALSCLQRIENTEVYNIICDSLSINPKPNNGTLRLPLKPVGLHSDNDTVALDTPHDPPAISSKLSASTSGKNSIGVDLPDPVPHRPVIADEKMKGGVRGKIEEIWDLILSKIANFKHWVHEDSHLTSS